LSWAFVDDLPWSTTARDRVLARMAAAAAAAADADQGRLFA